MAANAPLREPTYLILVALAGGPRHGYGIIKAVEDMSSGRVVLRAGTLYGALERLTAEGHVEPDGEEAAGGPTRRYYRLTASGRDLLTTEAARLSANASLAWDRLGVSPA